jgi:ABC-type spermidine/putrescine transport system permease subunit II
MKRSFFSAAVLAFVLAFLYVPIILVVVYGFIPNGISMSFTDAQGRFIGFSLKWY